MDEDADRRAKELIDWAMSLFRPDEPSYTKAELHRLELAEILAANRRWPSFRLPPNTVRILELMVEYEQTQEQCAATLRLELSSVKKAVQRARKAYAAWQQQYFGGRF